MIGEFLSSVPQFFALPELALDWVGDRQGLGLTEGLGPWFWDQPRMAPAAGPGEQCGMDLSPSLPLCPFVGCSEFLIPVT